MLRDDEILLDLARASQLILEFTAGMDKYAFSLDPKTQSSVLYQIVILGEAVNRLSQSFIDSHSEIPFNKIRGTRNRVIHEYDDIDLDILWDAIEQKIPDLLAVITPLLPVEEA